jgi:hypothetical protein
MIHEAVGGGEGLVWSVPALEVRRGDDTILKNWE